MTPASHHASNALLRIIYGLVRRLRAINQWPRAFQGLHQFAQHVGLRRAGQRQPTAFSAHCL